MTDPFAPGVRPLTAPAPGRAGLHVAGPVAEIPAPAGGTAWVVTDDDLARTVLTDPRFGKDPALLAPDRPAPEVGGEPPASERLSLTTTDGPVHRALRHAHAPLLSHRAVAAHTDRVTATARELLHAEAAAAEGDGVRDLAAEFLVRYPLTVVLDVVGVPRDRLNASVTACRGMLDADPGVRGAAFGALLGVCAAAAREPGSFADSLRDNAADAGTPLDDDQLAYLLFGLVFAGQLTTESALGALLVRALAPGAPTLGGLAPDGTAAAPTDPDDLVRDVLHDHPPAPFTLWRYTTAAVELAGTTIPAGAPVLVDIAGIHGAGIHGAGMQGSGIHGAGVHGAGMQGAGARNGTSSDLAFGHGPHFCVGAHLATLELRVLLTVLREDFPRARLAADPCVLTLADPGGIQGPRLTSLPVALGPTTVV
ncbi:cytochrome P450 family protein [Pseudonocardia phyllosphaerae]|uniref:cytochrome P450 n=1 Tax=Pseudonocardia phyllosphaerae TaxID=3390502 RepID=UPI00397C6163